MPRRRKAKDPFIEVIPILGVLFLVAWALLPQFREVVVWGSVIGVVAVATLIGIVIYKKMTQRGPDGSPLVEESLPYHKRILRLEKPLSSPELLGALPLALFTPELLAALEWRRFEILVTLFFQKTGYEASRSRVGPDGGVDIIVRHLGESQVASYVQCKAWHVYNVGVKPVRELYGVMAADEVPHGSFVTTGAFSSEAMLFAQGKPLVLISGADLLKDLNNLPEDTRREILAEVTAGDYTTPTCPRCDIKMIERKGPSGAFWGCLHFPRCRQHFQIKKV